jgi:hypothetical protein
MIIASTPANASISKKTPAGVFYLIELVNLPHPIYNSVVAEVMRWNDVIRNIGVVFNPFLMI